MGGGLDGYSWTAEIGRFRLIVELSESGTTGCTSALIPVRRIRRWQGGSGNLTKVKNIIMPGDERDHRCAVFLRSRVFKFRQIISIF